MPGSGVDGYVRRGTRMSEEIVMKQLKLFGRDFPVPLPPHGFFSERIADRVLVLGAATGMKAGLGADRAVLEA